MPTQKPSRTARSTTARQPLPERYVQKSLAGVDRRYAVVKELKARLRELIEYTGADTPQKCALCEEAVWLQHRLSRLRVRAIETGECDDNSITQMANSLSGLFTKLGIDKAEARELDLADVLKNSRSTS